MKRYISTELSCYITETDNEHLLLFQRTAVFSQKLLCLICVEAVWADFYPGYTQHYQSAHPDQTVQRTRRGFPTLCSHAYAYVGLVRRRPAGTYLKVKMCNTVHKIFI